MRIALLPRLLSRQGLGLAVAALLVSNGVVVFEQISGRDLIEVVSGADSTFASSALTGGQQDRHTSSGVSSESGAAPVDQAGNRVAPESDGPESASATAKSSHPGGGGSSAHRNPSRGGAPSTTGPGGTTVSDPGTLPSGGGSTADVTAGGEVAVSNASTGTAPRVASPTPKAPQTETVSLLSDLAGFVQQARGLQYKNPVATHILEEAAFQSKSESLRLQPLMARARQAQDLFRSLGLLPDGTDFAAEIKRLSGGPIGSVYDERTNELFVRQTDFTPFLKSTIVHELTRALDDQWFELHRPDLNRTFDDPSIAFEALVAGDATSAQARYIASLPEAQRNDAKAEQQRIAGERPKDVAPAVIATLTFRSGAGQLFADNLRRNGADRLDAAFRNPPVSAEQILHPEKYVAGEQPQATNRPAADGPVSGTGRLGQLFLTLMLAGYTEPQLAASAAQGWGGDTYVTWTQGSQTCSRLTVSTDGGVDQAKLRNALSAWATKTNGTMDGTGPFTATRCA